MAASLAVILLLGLPARKIFEKLKLPGLIGMLVLGVLIGPYGFNLLQEDMLKISGDLRGIALIIILLRAGFGIDKDDLPHIFERFYKGKNSTPDSVGIGLSLAKAIIEKDNGTINVESSDKGSSFIIKYFNS